MQVPSHNLITIEWILKFLCVLQYFWGSKPYSPTPPPSWPSFVAVANQTTCLHQYSTHMPLLHKGTTLHYLPKHTTTSTITRWSSPSSLFIHDHRQKHITRSLTQRLLDNLLPFIIIFSPWVINHHPFLFTLNQKKKIFFPFFFCQKVIYIKKVPLIYQGYIKDQLHFLCFELLQCAPS